MSKTASNDVAKQVRIQVYTTEEKHRAFKMICAGNGEKMTDVVDKLITAYLKKNGVKIEN
ncbi:hypothetical protein NF324_002199 [Salmonella enterica]|nr:hypothetical protein [Salmonella enterica]